MAKFGMNLLLWTSGVDESIFPVLDDIKEWGYDGVELPVFDFDSGAFEKIGKKLSDLGLERTAVTVCTDDANPISSDPAIREAGVNRLKQAIDMCAASGATHLLGPIHSALGTFSGQGRTEEEWNWGKESLAKAADYAQQNNVMLVCEYLNRFECYFLNCAEDTAKFCREVNHPHLKMMYDTFHA
ncbi:MAG: sugar phosphate isomerase/epimerase, partial [Planctomycetaceae bacterium]|nr:sugar phosphate isomerase/epimerase [Planctomycetaceae bacterium]